MFKSSFTTILIIKKKLIGARDAAILVSQCLTGKTNSSFGCNDLIVAGGKVVPQGDFAFSSAVQSVGHPLTNLYY